MKKMNLAVLLAALLSLSSLTSCLSGGEGMPWDIAELVTVHSNGIGGVYLTGDASNYTYKANEAIFAALKKEDGKYFERAHLYMKLADGESFSTYKTEYTLSKIGVNLINIDRDCTTRPDTLDGKKEYPLIFLNQNPWARNKYINFHFDIETDSKLNLQIKDLELYADSVVKDTLFLRFLQKRGVEQPGSGYTLNAFASFKMPINKTPSNAFDSLYQKAVKNCSSDSIKIVITAKGKDNKELKTKMFYKKEKE
ncbi:MAG: hypothetical protein ACRCY5_03850 [Phocaeicola sp.]